MTMQLFTTFMIVLIGAWPGADFWTNQKEFQLILGLAPRVTLASMIAYFFSEFTNSVILSKMKYHHEGKRGFKQGWRFVASTIAAEFVDSIVFMSIGFIGILAPKDVLLTILTIWGAKVIYEIVALPFSTRLAEYVKRVEGVDMIDHPLHTDYNPFTGFFTKRNLLPDHRG